MSGPKKVAATEIAAVLSRHLREHHERLANAAAAMYADNSSLSPYIRAREALGHFLGRWSNTRGWVSLSRSMIDRSIGQATRQR